MNEFADNLEPTSGTTATLDTLPVRKKKRPIAYQTKTKNVSTEFPLAKEETHPTKNKSIFWASLALMLLGPVLLLAGLFSSTPPPIEQPLLPPVVQQQNIPIEDIQIGTWVKANNPELSEEEHLQAQSSIDSSSMRVVSLELLKDDNSLLRVKLLRNIDWIEENKIADGGLLDVELPELGASGMAYVHSVVPCPDIIVQPNENARLVTATFVHEAATAFDLQIVDANGKELETIGVTGSHPMWSEARQDFVAVEELTTGEELLSTYGNPIFVGSIEPRAGPETVYNIEVDTEHVYDVTSSGVLAHNNCYGKRKNGQWKAKTGPKVKGLLNRPKLSEPTKLLIQKAYGRGIDKLLNSKGNLKSSHQYGHNRGFENRRLLLSAKKMKFSQRQLKDYVNKRWEKLIKIETKHDNLSHKFEKKGNGDLGQILTDMKSFLKGN